MQQDSLMSTHPPKYGLGGIEEAVKLLISHFHLRIPSSSSLFFSTFPQCFQIFSNRTRRVHQKAVRGAWGEGSVGGVVQKRAVPLCTYGRVPHQLVPVSILGVPQFLSCLSSACYGLARVMCDRRKPHPAMPSSLLPLPQVLAEHPTPLLSFGDIFRFCKLIWFSSPVDKFVWNDVLEEDVCAAA